MNFEYILWYDAFSVDEWTDQIETEPCKIETIGMLVHESDLTVSISHSKQVDAEVYCCTIVIPKNCIISRHSVRGVKG